MTNKERIGKWRERREKAKHSMGDMEKFGFTRAQISKWERGIVSPTSTTFDAYEKLLAEIEKG